MLTRIHKRGRTYLEELLNALPSATTHPAIQKARAAIARAEGRSDE